MRGEAWALPASQQLFLGRFSCWPVQTGLWERGLKEATSGSPEVGEGGSCFAISTSNPSLRRDRNSPL